jgi:hypothetical protein
VQGELSLRRKNIFYNYIKNLFVFDLLGIISIMPIYDDNVAKEILYFLFYFKILSLMNILE